VTLLELERTETTSPGEALFREARRLRRRRWGIGLIILLTVVATSVVVYATSSRSNTPPGRIAPTTPQRNGKGTASKAIVPTHSPDLIQPGALAAEPNGDMLILDSSRDQILRLTPNGTLSVFAGTGREGFTGDGGPAVDAELNFNYFSESEIAVAPSGSVYFVDDGSCRLREVNSHGIIRTIVSLPLIHMQPSGTSCQLSGVAISPSGVVYVSTNSDIKRVTSRGTLAWVAGKRGTVVTEPKHPTASTVVMSPGSIAFDAHGDLDIWSWAPRVMYQLSPSGKVTNLGWAYATQLTETPRGNVLAGTHFGEIESIAAQGTSVEPYRNVDPQKVDGLNWGHVGFQENGIAVTRSGVIYVDNAQGNGYGAGTALVRIAKNGKAELVPIHTPLSRTLPLVGAPGFPTSLYPAPRRSATSTLAACPNNAGIEPFTPTALKQSKVIATNFQSGQYASDIVVTDRSWWVGAFDAFQGADLGVHLETKEMPAEESADANEIGLACGDALVRDSIAVSIRQSGYSGASGTIYLLNRDGHPLVYYAAIANN